MYKISVVTPLYNVDMGMFEKGCRSMRRQTIGFTNIQWIIVVHNSEPHYFHTLQKMFRNDTNVIIKNLNDGIQSPSAPRNYGVTLATAPYIGFLDGDDSYRENCLEEAVNALDKTNAQLVCFRREVEMENNSLHPLMEYTLWNQLDKIVVVERDHWEMEKMFTIMWGMVTSKVFNRKFLIDNNITFDKEIYQGEDVMFCAQSFNKAQRICYLPQMIGYHYYINSKSLVQKKRKDAETLVNYAKGFAKLFKAFEEIGIYAPNDIWMPLLVFSNFILASADLLTLEDRQQIKTHLAPFIEGTDIPKPTKCFPEEVIETAVRISTDVIMSPEGGLSDFTRDTRDGRFRLITILRANKTTDYGSHYGFSDIQSIKEYQERVPLTQYEDYQSLIKLQTNIGETGILTTKKANRYVRKRSGKILPITTDHIIPYIDVIAKLLRGHHTLLLCSNRPLNENIDGLTFVENLESILVKDYISYGYYAFGHKTADLTPSISYLFSEEEKFDFYTFMLKGIANEQLDQIVAMSTSDVLNAFQVLESKWEEMTDNIAKNLPDRAETLRANFSQGFQGIAVRIWPHLERVVAYGAGDQQEATEALRYYIKGTPHHHGFYVTSETLMAKAVQADCDLFELNTDTNFYEFIPVDDNDKKVDVPVPVKKEAPLLISQLQSGKTYQMVVTNNAGLYRYLTDHRITFQENKPDGSAIIKIEA